MASFRNFVNNLQGWFSSKSLDNLRHTAATQGWDGKTKGDKTALVTFLVRRLFGDEARKHLEELVKQIEEGNVTFTESELDVLEQVIHRTPSPAPWPTNDDIRPQIEELEARV